jgi:hypothetical protein
MKRRQSRAAIVKAALPQTFRTAQISSPFPDRFGPFFTSFSCAAISGATSIGTRQAERHLGDEIEDHAG